MSTGAEYRRSLHARNIVALLICFTSGACNYVSAGRGHFTRASLVSEFSQELSVPANANFMQHCALPANLPTSSKSKHRRHELVIIKMWIRIMISNGRLSAKGFVWAPSHDRHNQPVWRNGTEEGWKNHFETSAPAFVKFHGSFFLRSIKNIDRHYYFNVGSKDDIRVLHMTNLLLHPDDLGGEFELRVESVHKHCQVFADAATPEETQLLKPPDEYAAEAVAKYGIVHRGEKPVIIVAALMHISDDLQFELMLDAFMKHHILVGVTRVVVYIGQGISNVVNKPKIQAHVVAGYLELLSWDGAPRTNREIGLGNDLYGPQYAIHNHALLRFWLVDCWLGFVDIDEFLMTIPWKEPDMMISQALSDCAGSGAMRELRVDRYLGFCLTCNQSKPDIESLMDPSVTSAFKHPLMIYGSGYKDNNPKSIVFPSWVLMFGVHQGWIFTGGHSNVQKLDQCRHNLRVLHMGNLQSSRYDLDNRALVDISWVDTNWWWMYKPDLPLFRSLIAPGQSPNTTSFSEHIKAVDLAYNLKYPKVLTDGKGTA